MKQIFSLFLIILLSNTLLAQNQITKELGNFTTLTASKTVKILLIPSDRNYIEIKIKNGDEQDLITEVVDGNLNISWYTGNWFTSWFADDDNSAEIKLYFKKLTHINVGSNARIQSNEPVTNKTFTLEATDGGRLQLIMGADNLNINSTSAGVITLKGEANSIDVNVSSGGEFWGAEFVTNSSKVIASSGSSAIVYSTQKIDLKAGSGASIKYRGNPPQKILDQSAWGGGSVKQM